MGTSHAEGEALRRLIEKWRDRADDIPHRTPEMPASEWALRLCADELEAALAPLSGPVDASREPEFVCGNDMGQVCREFWPGSPGSWCNGCVNRELHEAAQWRAHGAQGVAATVKASPDDWPAARLVTPQELRTFLSETIAAAAAVPSSPTEPREPDVVPLDADVPESLVPVPSSPAQPHQPPAVHHMCQPSNLDGAPPFASWCHHERTWVDGAAQQDDYKCGHCGTLISTNISEWSKPALPPSSPVADSPEICICAAVQLDNGVVLRGHRHDDCFQTALKYGYKERITQAKRGFVTSRNRFVGREEGAALQRAARIVSEQTGQFTDLLFSEDLYFNDNAASAPSPSAGAAKDKE